MRKFLMKKILIVVDAPGPAEFIETVVPLLQKKSEVCIVTVNTITEAPYKILKRYGALRVDREEDAEQIYKNFNPDILAVATSSLVLGPYVNNRFTELAHQNNKKIICFQDFWANHRWPMNYHMMKYWQKILVPDALAKKLLLEDGYQGKIVITGNPNFDKFKTLNVLKERKWLREKFGLNENNFVVLYVGRGTPQSYMEDEITFGFVANSLRALQNAKNSKKIVLIVRPHPRDEEQTRYEKFFADLNILNTSAFPSGDDLLPVADLIIGIHSSHHIQACYLRIPAVSVELHDGGKRMLEKISLSDFPPNTVGANIGIYNDNVEELKNVFHKLISDKKFVLDIQKAQKKYFSLPKVSAAKKVVREFLLD